MNAIQLFDVIIQEASNRRIKIWFHYAQSCYCLSTIVSEAGWVGDNLYFIYGPSNSRMFLDNHKQCIVDTLEESASVYKIFPSSSEGTYHVTEQIDIYC